MKSKRTIRDDGINELAKCRGRSLHTPGLPGDRALRELKVDLCNAIDLVIVRNQWSYCVAAAYVGTHASVISLVVNKRIARLSLSQLFRYLNAICPGFRVMISVDSSLGSSRP